MLRTTAIIVAAGAAWLVGCAPTVSPRTLQAWEDDEGYGDEPLAPFFDPPDAPPPALGDVAWQGDATPSADGLWAWTDPGELPEVRDAAGHRLPLRHTDVVAELRGHFADVTVTQTFVNDATAPIEVVYAFPLPENSAVAHMRMKIGDRVIESDVAKRDDARRTYEQALAEGYTAALLEQERPNIFTQSLANVGAGETIDVEIHYLQSLSWDAGEYEFVFPMVVGPRFVPGNPTGGSPRGVGASPDTDVVPDASRISPPVVGTGMRRGDDFTIEVRARPGFPIADWEVPTHAVVASDDAGGKRWRLRAADELPNRDFVLRYRTAGEQAHATMLLGPPDATGRGHFALVVEPPALDVDRLVGRREVVFVVDRSGSMSGPPLALAKQTVRDALMHLRPVDSFNVVGFESGTEVLWSAPRPANVTNLAHALRFLDGMTAGGGTMMAGAVEAALGDPVAEGHNRYVMFLTDGFIGNEDPIFAGADALVRRLAQSGQRARVFAVGIGSSPNRHLVAGLSRAGRGVPLEVGLREHSPRAVQAFARYIDAAVVEDLRLEGDALTLSGQHPEALGDLFASHLAVALGEYRGDTAARPKLHGTVDGAPVTLDVAVVPSAETDATLDALWARAAVADLEPRLWAGPDAEAEAEITRLGLEHHLVTAFTSFVAVDRSRVVSDGDPQRVVEPTIIPEGVDEVMAGAVPYGASQGISLAGTSGAEASYSMADSDDSPLRGRFEMRRVERGPVARVTIGLPSAAGAVRTGGVRKAIREVRDQLQRCWEESGALGRGDRHELTVRISFVGGRPTIELVGSAGDEDTDACLHDELDEAAWPRLSEGAVVEVPLRLSAH